MLENVNPILEARVYRKPGRQMKEGRKGRKERGERGGGVIQAAMKLDELQRQNAAGSTWTWALRHATAPHQSLL